MSGTGEILSLGEALDALASPDALERFATATDVPMVVVDWPAAGEPCAAPGDVRVRLATEQLAALACVSVAITSDVGDARLPELRDAFDVCVTDATELARVRGTVQTHPLASTTLAQLLRGSLEREIEAGLVAESLAYSSLQAGPEFVHWRAGRERKPVPPDPAGGAVLAERDGDTLRIVLNRPARHNALSRSVRDGLCEALDVALFDPSVERVEVTGRGPSFCSGGDLDEFGDFPDPTTAHLVRTTRSPARGFARLARRLRVRVHGACLGAGVELPAFAGHVVAAPDARFGLPELLLGLVPGAGGTVSLPRRIGRQATAKLALMGGTIDAEAALALGLIDAIEN